MQLQSAVLWQAINQTPVNNLGLQNTCLLFVYLESIQQHSVATLPVNQEFKLLNYNVAKTVIKLPR